jgi:hypothetical protein
MPDRDAGKAHALAWPLPLIGILMAVGLAWGIGWSQAREQYWRQQIPAAYAAVAKNEARRVCRGTDPVKVFECVNEKAETAAQAAHDRQDLSAQQRAASSALIAAIVGLLALIVTAIGVYFVKRTLDATLEAVADTGRATNAMLAANEIALRAQRPWLSLEIVQFGPFEVDVGGRVFVPCTLAVKNHGASPALHIGEVIGYMESTADFKVDYEDFNRKSVEAVKLSSVCIAPHQNIEITRRLLVETKHPDATGVIEGVRVRYWWFGVGYNDGSSPVRHHTIVLADLEIDGEWLGRCSPPVAIVPSKTLMA